MYKNTIKQTHSFHLVDPSPYPFFAACSALLLTISFTASIRHYNYSFDLLCFSLIMLIIVASLWWANVVREGTYEGQHTKRVKKGLMLGMLLFIVSEVMFFFSFFFAFFYVSLNPSHVLGGIWPPFLFETIPPFSVPLLNTVILVSSGATITVAHEAIISGSKSHAILALFATIFLALIFTSLQFLEYKAAPFTMHSSVFGSIFYMATGFHGFHVIIGTIFIIVCLFRLLKDHFTIEHHCGFECAAWYWHFVDVVWLFLFVTIYYWGS